MKTKKCELEEKEFLELLNKNEIKSTRKTTTKSTNQNLRQILAGIFNFIGFDFILTK